MDTFNARFIFRICEMLSDADSRVVASAVKTLGVLHGSVCCLAKIWNLW